MTRNFYYNNYFIKIKTQKYVSFYCGQPYQKATYWIYDFSRKEWIINNKTDLTNYIDYKPLELINHIKNNLLKLLRA